MSDWESHELVQHRRTCREESVRKMLVESMSMSLPIKSHNLVCIPFVGLVDLEPFFFLFVLLFYFDLYTFVADLGLPGYGYTTYMADCH